MNIHGLKNQAGQLCVCAVALSVMLLPVQAAELIPVPNIKPAIVNNAIIPIPSIKPKYKKISVKELYNNSSDLLSATQSHIYADIFKAQSLGEFTKADILIEKIKDTSLMGHVLSQRYLHVSYKSKYSELHDWMNKYADHPDANKIYKLALSRGLDNDKNNLKQPVKTRILSQINEPVIYHPKRLSNKDSHIADKLSQLKIASKLLYKGDISASYDISSKISDELGEYIADASWIAGLALWQQDDFANAAKYFERASNSDYASGWLKSAGYYWAARCHKRTGDNKSLALSLEKAFEHPYTFYGLLAANSLGKNYNFSWQAPQYTNENEKLILSYKAGKRAFALVAAGQYNLAESELLRLNYKGNLALQRAVLSYASHVDLPSLSLRLGNMVKNNVNGEYYDRAIYPTSPWVPEDGYKLDPALIHAVIRQESRFNQIAKSYNGARGLMQIMPKTAKYVAKTNNYPAALNNANLNLPETNMKVGQDYLKYLLKGQNVNGNIVSLLIAYNAGPGNLSKWKKRTSNNDDTLLFIETLPVKETRDYVEKVLSNYWIYSNQAGIAQPTLAALSSGQTPKYAYGLHESSQYKLASN